MMRELTVAERRFVYRDYCCCFCGKALFDGPRGGAGINMVCALGCGAVVNVIQREYRDRYGEGVAFFGQVIEEPNEPFVRVKLE